MPWRQVNDRLRDRAKEAKADRMKTTDCTPSIAHLFDIKTDVTLECPCCRAYNTVPRPADLPADVRLIEIICPDCDDGDRHAEVWYSAPGIVVSQDHKDKAPA